jgi:hypothetical protein
VVAVAVAAVVAVVVAVMVAPASRRQWKNRRTVKLLII